MYSWASLRVWQNTIGTLGKPICNSASPSAIAVGRAKECAKISE
ncbi:Uncharacterised protein [Mycobacterium tuberculosis]|nr:Uncharacterised protein [Mycobacterium tuberculosis]CPB44090.1 Uncharacterised protein [Mycobacterium tuberculosis]